MFRNSVDGLMGILLGLRPVIKGRVKTYPVSRQYTESCMPLMQFV